MKRSLLSTAILILVTVFTLCGCIEHRYYHTNHPHSDGYYNRHHRAHRPGLDIDIHR